MLTHQSLNARVDSKLAKITFTQSPVKGVCLSAYLGLVIKESRQNATKLARPRRTAQLDFSHRVWVSAFTLRFPSRNSFAFSPFALAIFVFVFVF